jgi:hypothetical protein
MKPQLVLRGRSGGLAHQAHRLVPRHDRSRKRSDRRIDLDGQRERRGEHHSAGMGRRRLVRVVALEDMRSDAVRERRGFGARAAARWARDTAWESRRVCPGDRGCRGCGTAADVCCEVEEAQPEDRVQVSADTTLCHRTGSPREQERHVVTSDDGHRYVFGSRVTCLLFGECSLIRCTLVTLAEEIGVV